MRSNKEGPNSQTTGGGGRKRVKKKKNTKPQRSLNREPRGLKNLSGARNHLGQLDAGTSLRGKLAKRENPRGANLKEDRQKGRGGGLEGHL